MCSWDKDNSILLDENFPISHVYYSNAGKNSKNEIVILNRFSSPKIISNIETEYFLNKINLNQIFFRIFSLQEERVQNLLKKLFLCSPDFALLLFLNLFETKNEYAKLISSLRTKKIESYLICLLLLNINYSQTQLMETLLENYILSFDLSKLKVWEALHKVLRTLSLKKDYIIIDKFAKVFAKVYWEQLENSEETHEYNSQGAIYLLVFIMILIDLDFKLGGRNRFN